MKKIFAFCLLALLLTACSKDSDSRKYSDDEIAGHWYAELPMTGTTDNWRTEEEGDVTDYDHIGIILYVNDDSHQGYWCHLYLKDGEVVNVAGFGRGGEEQENAYFIYQLHEDGSISLSHYMQNVPQPVGMRYNGSNITSSVEDMAIRFMRPEQMGKEDFLEEVWQLLADAGMGGYDDGGDHLGTDITDDPATKPSRGRENNLEE